MLVPVGGMLGYVALEVWLGSKLSFWREDLAKATFTWLVFSGLVLFFRFNEASTGGCPIVRRK